MDWQDNVNRYIRNKGLLQKQIANKIGITEPSLCRKLKNERKWSVDDLIKMSKCNSIKDGYIYPALFAFRHSLELIMKDTLNILVGKNNVADVVKNKVHNLETIWNVFKNKAPYDETTIVIDNLIKELSNTDPNSFNFRYSYDIKGNPIDISLNNEFVMDDDIRKKKTFIIDNENLKMIMLKMYDYFDRINWQMQK